MRRGTTIPAAKRALVDLITARLGSTARVLYSRPRDGYETQADDGAFARVHIDPVANCSYVIPFVTGGPLTVDETYTLPIVIRVTSDSDDLESCDIAAAELAHGVIAAIAQKPSLGFDVDNDEQLLVFFARPASGSHTSIDIGDGNAVFGTNHVIDVVVTARLTLS